MEQKQYIDKVDVPIVQSLQEHVEVAKTFPQEHNSEHTQAVNVPVPQIAVPVSFYKETDEVILPVTAKRSSECIVEQIVAMPVPQIQELWKLLKTFRKSALLSTLLNKSPQYLCLLFRNEFWKSRRSFPRSAFRSVLLDRLMMCQCLRS